MFKLLKNDQAVSPIVATLVLIVVAIIGAAAVGLLMGSFSNDVSKKASAGDVAAGSSSQILIAGSTTVKPVMEDLAKAYMGNNTGVKVTVQGGGSGAGIASAGMGIVDLGMSSEAMTAEQQAKYPNLKAYQIGGRGVVFIVNGNTPATIAKTDLATEFDGTTTPTHTEVVVRSDVSGTADTASDYLFGDKTTIYTSKTNKKAVPGNDGVVAEVKKTTGAIGFCDFGYYTAGSGVSLVSITEGSGATAVTYTPSSSNLKAALKGDSTKYPTKLTSGLYVLVNGEPTPIVQNFLTFVQSPGAKAYFDSNGVYSIFDLQ